MVNGQATSDENVNQTEDVGSQSRRWRLPGGRLPWRKVIGLVLFIMLAGGAGFLGGRLSQEDTIDTSTAAGQKQIVTSQGQLINKIAKDVGPSVVSINVSTKTIAATIFGPQTSTQQSAGTGIIISADGVIMTNRHVVPAGSTSVSVTLADGTEYDNVEVLGRTSSRDSLDVAFLKIKDLKGRVLKVAAIGDSSTARVGDSVVAIGNALGEFQNSVTSGIISGFGRQVQAGSGGSSLADSMTAEDLGNLIQTDAAINEGNSGGPLVNMSGRVIGINTAIASGAENIGFAIPSNDVAGLIAQVLKTGSFARPYLGVRYIALTSAIAKKYALPKSSGAYIAPRTITGEDPVVPNSPADNAGLAGGDIITAVDGVKLTERTTLTSVLNKYQPGQHVKLTVIRNGKMILIDATLGKQGNND